MSWQRRAAERLARLAIRLAPAGRSDWARAQAAELEAVEGDWAALAWACGGLQAMCIEWLRAVAAGNLEGMMARPRIVWSVGAGVLIVATLWLGMTGFGAWRRHRWFGDAEATVVNSGSRQVTSAGQPEYLCEAVLHYEGERGSQVVAARYAALDAGGRDRWLQKWAGGTHHWLHYWRGSAGATFYWQDDPVWKGYFGRIPGYLHAGLALLVVGALLMAVGKRART